MKKKTRKRLIITVAGIVMVLAAVFLFINNRLKSIAEVQLEQILNANKNKNYTVRFEKLKINWLTTTLIIKGITINPDSTILNKVKEKDTGFSAVKIYIKALRIRRINVWDAFHKIANIGEIIFDKPDITFYKFNKREQQVQTAKTEDSKVLNTDSLYLEQFTELGIGRILLRKMNLHFVNLNDSSGENDIYIRNLSVEINQIGIKPFANESHYFRFSIGNYSIGASKNEILIAGGRYKIGFKSFDINKKSKSLVIKNFQLKPVKQKGLPPKKERFSEFFYTITIPLLKTEYIDFSHFSALHAGKITLLRPDISIHKEINKGDNIKRRPKTPTQALRNTGFPFTIDTLLVENGFLQYTERSKPGTTPLKVFLAGMRIKILDITSEKKKITDGATVTAFLKAKLMNKIPMEVTLNMPIKTNRFTFKGELGSGPLTSFNRITKPIGLVFNGGRLNSMQFDGIGNNITAWGTMTMKYKDLNVNILKSNKNEKQGLFSWAANNIVKSENPSNGYLHSVTMFFQRKIYKGFFNMLIGSLLSGVKATLIPALEQKNIKNADEYLGISKEKRKEINKKKRERKRLTIKKNRKQKKQP